MDVSLFSKRALPYVPKLSIALGIGKNGSKASNPGVTQNDYGNPPEGIYEALLDKDLKSVLQLHPELRSIFGKLDPEEEPARYSAFLGKLLEKALRLEDDPATRLRLCNEIIERIASGSKTQFLQGHRLVPDEKPLLLEITPPNYAQGGILRPETTLVESSLFTGSPADPQLIHELEREMRSADSMDLLVSFIKWSGLRLLMPAFEEMTGRGGRVRIITTSYMGASDAEAVEWLARWPNVEIRVSYDTERTRLHAKAYHFRRKSDFPTAYIGSANMSQAAMTSGLEWNLKVTAQDMPHILEKFLAEFETYWNSREFIAYNREEPTVLREALKHARSRQGITPVFFDIRPHAFQERILDALESERLVHQQWRNLVVAATELVRRLSQHLTSKDFTRANSDKPVFCSLPIERKYSSNLLVPLELFFGLLTLENSWWVITLRPDTTTFFARWKC